jgi:uncharacterized protein YaiI (UPF0178 family)
MSIWVDADACPRVIKTILFRAAQRTGTAVTLIANHSIPVPPSKYIRSIRVADGFDVADKQIVKLVQAGDLVITADIPLAAEVIEKDAQALSPRGEAFGKHNIRSRLNMRDFMDTMRASGVNTGGPPAISEADKREFANNLDRYLAQRQARTP